MGNQPPLKIFFSKSGGVDRCSTPPPIQNLGGVETPPTPPCLAPLVLWGLRLARAPLEIW